MNAAESKKVVTEELKNTEKKEKARSTIKTFFKVKHDEKGEIWKSKYKRFARWEIEIVRNGNYVLNGDLIVKFDGEKVFTVKKYMQDTTSLFRARYFINTFKKAN
jgi:hypothetical protein